LQVVHGDITRMEVDAIVNAANSGLLGGGGVDGAIHRAAGPELLAECRTLGGCLPGQAKITRGHRLSARFVIHTVGPIWRGGKHGEAQTLANCYRNSLRLAVENDIKTIAFPAISCGAYGYPIQEAAHIALKTTREFLGATDKMDKVIFVLWGEDVYKAYRQVL
jgi:O-acetyl-ADP-ribose deacetylase (regulator of RNase III)